MPIGLESRGLLPADRFNIHSAATVAQHQYAFLNGRLQLHAAGSQFGQCLGCRRGDAPHLQFVQASSISTRIPFHQMSAECANGYSNTASDFVASLGDGLVFRLTHLNPQALLPCEIGERNVRDLRGRTSRRRRPECHRRCTNFEVCGRCNAIATRANHHPLICLAWVPSQCERVVRVVTVLNVCDLQIGFVDGGFECHGLGASKGECFRGMPWSRLSRSTSIVPLQGGGGESRTGVLNASREFRRLAGVATGRHGQQALFL